MGENKKKLQYFDELFEKFKIPDENVIACVKARLRLKGKIYENMTIDRESVKPIKYDAKNKEIITHLSEIQIELLLKAIDEQVEEEKDLDDEKLASLCRKVMEKLQLKLPQFLRSKHSDAESEKGKAEIKHQDLNEYMVKMKLVHKSSFSEEFRVVETKAENSFSKRKKNNKKNLP